jgi:glutathione S-transferase
MASAVAAKANPKFRYLSAWFCPYAHRATLALEHHAGRVDYEWVEALVRRVVAFM